MRKLLLIALILAPVLSIGQSIKTSKVDKFTKERVIETSFEKISSGGAFGLMRNCWISFNKNGETETLRFKWNTHEIVGVREGADLIFLDKDGNTYKFTNRFKEVSSRGAGTIGFVGAEDYGVNLYFDGDLSIFKEKELTDFRIHTTDGYVDFKMMPNANKKAKALYKVFEKEINKGN